MTESVSIWITSTTIFTLQLSIYYFAINKDIKKNNKYIYDVKGVQINRQQQFPP